MRSILLFVVALVAASVCTAADRPHNVIIFVADGLRGSIVDAQTAPNMDALRHEGVSFPNSHALFPTVTTANASAIATGHFLGDTGDFANTIYAGQSIATAHEDTVTPFLEDDVVLGDMDAKFMGNYLTEATLLAIARERHYNTAALGKLGPTLIQDHTQRNGSTTLILDDRTGMPLDGLPISDEFARELAAAGLSPPMPATDKPNRAQQQYVIDVATKVVLPRFKKEDKPFVLVLWMRDPDATQHTQLDSRPGMVPGINGATSIAAIRNTDNNLGQLRSALKSLDLESGTNIFVTSDHGFSTISKQSDTSQTARCHYDDVPQNELPPGFLAIDLANVFDQDLYDPDTCGLIERQKSCDVASTKAISATPLPKHPKNGNGLIGREAKHPEAVVTAGAGAGLIYLPGATGRSFAKVLVNFLLTQDYTGGVFIDDALAPIPGTLPLSAIGLTGSARTPHPSIVVSFRSFSTGCEQPLKCGAEVADTTYGQGQGMHGAFSRSDTWNFMAAVGPDFRKGFVDPAPVSNADIAPTFLRLWDPKAAASAGNVGRALTEAMPGGQMPEHHAEMCFYAPADLGKWPDMDQFPKAHLQPALRLQRVGAIRYFDAAGLIDRTLGLATEAGLRCSENK